MLDCRILDNSATLIPKFNLALRDVNCFTLLTCYSQFVVPLLFTCSMPVVICT